MHAQVRQALENTRNILKAVGGTTDDIMSIRYYFKAGYMEEGLAALRDLGSDYFKSPYPSTTELLPKVVDRDGMKTAAYPSA